jgi:hypothetical protein
MVIGAKIPIKKDSADLWHRIRVRYDMFYVRTSAAEVNAHGREVYYRLEVVPWTT